VLSWLAAGLVLTAVLPGTARGQSPEGQWEGAVEVQGQSLEVVVDLAAADGEWTGQIDIPAQGVSDRRLSAISAAGDSVSFRIPGVPGDPAFHGRLVADGDSVRGDFRQGGRTFPFRLARVGEPEIAGGAPAASEALEGYDEFVRESLERWNVPGAAVAIVKDGELIHAEGYGVRNRATGDPVTAGTVMPIGSSTKAFTALLVSDLVAEGKLEWDAPVRSQVDGFRLEDDYASEHATLVDLLSHRTGLPRHDLLWYAEDAPPLERGGLVKRLRHLEPSAGFRARWQYNNLMYATAGWAAGQAAGATWEELVRSRILEPLGMESTSLSIDALRSTPDHARGYREPGEDEASGGGVGRGGLAPRATVPDTAAELVQMDYRPIGAMGPAGSINSTAEDMGRWLELQLSGGEVDGRQVFRSGVVQTTHSPREIVRGGIFARLFSQPEMPYLMYGLGWFVQPYRGHRMIQHGGNIDGFSALVSFMPDDGVGVAVLTNKNATFLPTALALSTFDRLLGLERKDWNRRYLGLMEQLERIQAGPDTVVDRKTGTSPGHPLSAYAGTYRNPGYGEITVDRGGDGLVARYHGVSFPLEHWHFDTFNGRTGDLALLRNLDVKLRFHTNERGDVASVSVPMEPAVSPVEFEKQPPERMSRASFLRAFVGDYRLMGGTATVRLRGDDTLALDLPGQAPVELLPYRGTRFDLEGQPGASVEFVREDGEVTRMLFMQAGQVLEAERAESG
jgi:CubicO group peptidase (beta-lactamase class C family)